MSGSVSRMSEDISISPSISFAINTVQKTKDDIPNLKRVSSLRDSHFRRHIFGFFRKEPEAKFKEKV